MASGVKVRCGMFVFGGVTASDMAADTTDAEMQPGIAQFQTFLTDIARGRHRTNLIQVATCLCHQPRSFRSTPKRHTESDCRVSSISRDIATWQAAPRIPSEFLAEWQIHESDSEDDMPNISPTIPHTNP